jgi:hypothetical protein
MASRRSTRVSNLSASLATLNIVNSAALAANKYNYSASGTLREYKLASLAVTASLGFQRPSWRPDVHSRLTTKLSHSRGKRHGGTRRCDVVSAHQSECANGCWLQRIVRRVLI